MTNPIPVGLCNVPFRPCSKCQPDRRIFLDEWVDVFVTIGRTLCFQLPQQGLASVGDAGLSQGARRPEQVVAERIGYRRARQLLQLAAFDLLLTQILG